MCVEKEKGGRVNGSTITNQSAPLDLCYENSPLEPSDWPSREAICWEEENCERG